MDRREFIVGGVATLGAPAALQAEEGTNLPRIGVLFVLRDDRIASYIRAHEEGLKELGWLNNRNIVIEKRFAGTMERMPAVVRELISLNARVIVTGPNPFIEVVKLRPRRYRS
jgi:putative ABC transport system substrate-binding protein